MPFFRQMSLVWITLVGLFAAACGSVYSIQNHQPRVEQGAIDLRAWNFAQDGLVWLKGDWSYYPDYLQPEDFRPELLQATNVMRVPGSPRFEDQKPKSYPPSNLSVLTLILKIEGLPADTPLAIWPDLAWHGTSFSVLTVDSLGQVHTLTEPIGPPPYNFRSSVLGYGGDEIISLPPTDAQDRYLLVHFVGNNMLSVFNGLAIGRPGDLQKHLVLRASERYVLLGSFLLLGLLCAVLSIQRRQDPLYALGFGVCLSLALRYIGTEGILTRLTEALGASLDVRYTVTVLVSLVTMIMSGTSIVFLCSFTRRIAPAEGQRRLLLWMQRICLGVIALGVPLVLYDFVVESVALSDRGAFAGIFVSYAVLDGLLMIVIFSVCLRVRSWSLHLGVGAFAHLAGFLWDFAVMGFSWDLPYLMHYGNLLFCFSLVLMIGKRFALTYEENTQLLIAIQEKEQARTLFFHNTSHELRTPLNGMIGFLELIGQGRYGPVPSAAIAQLQKCLRLAESLKLQVNTILDLAKLRKGDDRTFARSFSLKELKADLDNLAEGLCLKSPDLSFHSSLTGSDLSFCSDKDKIFTILRNLLGNAFKFRDPDRLNAVSLEMACDEAGLTLTVSDQGIGIPAADLPRIFDEFTQVQSNARRSYEGTGLGLTMVRSLAETLGGRIEVHSVLGEGSRFQVWLPRLQPSSLANPDAREAPALDTQYLALREQVSPEPTAFPPKEDTEYGQGWRIMVIDDQPTNVELIVAILAADHYTCESYTSGQKALESMRRNPPDLVLLDLMMPGLSGEDLLKEMRAELLLSQIPVIVITARASEEDKILALRSGADDYLPKPIYADELRVRVRNCIERLRLHRLALEAERATVLEQSRLLEVKNQILANTSHELRTPINGLLGLAEHLVELPHLRTEERTAVESMLEASRRLARLVDSVLDVSAADKGLLSMRLQSVDLQSCLEDALRALDIRDKHAGVRLEKQLGMEPLWIEADRRACVQALTALLSNAFRFTLQGAVTLRADRDDSSCYLRIQDTGSGMSPEQLSRIGQVFEQGDGTSSRSQGGTGLGLALASRLLRLQGIKLSFQSQLGQGTQVTLQFKRTLPVQGIASTTQAFSSDCPAESELPLASGAASIASVPERRFPPSPTNRERTEGAGAPPVLTLFSRNRTLSAAEAVPSPPEPKSSSSHTADTQDASLARESQASRHQAPLQARRIPLLLVVDDEPLNRRVIINHLLSEDYECIEAASGTEALALYESHGPFDAVLLDVMMPEMDGYACARRLRAFQGAIELPILMVTARQQLDDLLAGFEAGANDYIHKPFSKAELIARLASHLHLAQTARAMRRFVPADMIRLLGCERVTDLRLGLAAQHALSIVFSDIVGFTRALEGMSPEGAFDWLNRCYQLLGPEVRKAGGFIDKYIGDAVMALFPESPDAALEAALAMHRRTDDLQGVRLGTGIHYGPVMVGTLGELERFDATVLSDAVNVASRIEGASKILGVPLLVSEPFRAALGAPDRWNWRCLGPIRLKGRQHTVILWEVLDAHPESMVRKQSYLASFDRARLSFEKGELTVAKDLFEALLMQDPDDRVLQVYLDRCAAALESGAVGDGVLELREKA